MGQEPGVCELMFESKKAIKLEKRVQDLEGAVRRMQNYLLAEQDVVVCFEPAKELTAKARGKKLN